VAFEPNKNLTARVERAVAAVLQREGHLTYPALLCELGVLTKQDLETWRAGRVPYLEKVIRTNLTRLMQRAFAIDVLARPHCGGRLRLTATLHDPAVIRKLLRAPGDGPLRGASRPRPTRIHRHRVLIDSGRGGRRHARIARRYPR
jgi:hypothetical protein